MTATGDPATSSGELDLRILLPPQVIPTNRYLAWHTGLVASPTRIFLGMVIECHPEAGENERAFSDLAPIRPETWLCIHQPDADLMRVKNLWWGGSTGGRGLETVTTRAQPWDPYEFPATTILTITYEPLGIQYEATFNVPWA